MSEFNPLDVGDRDRGRVPPPQEYAHDHRIPFDLERLPRLPISELRRLWAEHLGKAKPPVQKRLLIRELAWRVQERIYGGLDAETRRLLNRAIKAARAELAARSKGEPESGPSAPRRRAHGEASTARLTPRDLPPATRLVRTWRGVTHEVHVLENGRGFLYRDQVYKSLSEVAREITGTRWSGPRFFGLTTRENSDGENAGGTKGRRRRPRAGGTSR